MRSGRTSKTQLYALEHYAPLYSIDIQSTQLDFQSIFENRQPVVVEIGFGMGHATLELAEKFPDTNFIGIEVYKPGVGRVLNEIHQRKLKNLRVFRGDAVKFVEQSLWNESVHAFHIFFPDPWPKKKHHKRRLLQSPFVKLLARRLQQGGYLYMVTDWEDYAEQILDVVSREPLLKNPFAGFSPPRPWRPRTSFQRKGEDKAHLIREIWAERVEQKA